MRAYLKNRRNRQALLVAATLVALILLAAFAAARPGGGSSYSGGSKSSSSSSGGGYSGGGGGGGDSSGLIFFLVEICIEYPQVGIPLVIIVIIGYAMSSRWRRAASGWSAGAGNIDIVMPPRPVPFQSNTYARPRTELTKLRATDPGFSLVVFEDFAYFLYAELHRGRGSGATDMLLPYVTPEVLARLPRTPSLAEVTGIIVGSITYENVSFRGGDTGEVHVVLVVEANYVERYRPQGEQRFFVKERLRLSRSVRAVSRSPEKARILTCTNCGAPAQNMRGSTCSFCHTPVAPGVKDWRVEGLEILEREPRAPLLTSTVEEQGTNLPTIVAPDAVQALQAVQTKDPTFQWPVFEARVRLIFGEIQVGWTGRNPMQLRPFMSDNLFQSQCVWIDLYKAARAINKTDGAQVTGVELAQCTSDAYFDAITVRVYGQGCDYTVSEDGKLLSGNPRKNRIYTEYWTMIRGAQPKGQSKGDRVCPNCGAPLAISMAGNCQYCAAKVTGGEYDWVLSRIEQDEAYRG